MSEWTPNNCPLDGEHNRIAQLVAPFDCDAQTNLRGISILLGAAGALSARFHDELDLGAELTDEEQAEWGAVVHLCLRFSDRYTFGSGYTPGEAAESLDYLAAHMIPEDQEGVPAE